MLALQTVTIFKKCMVLDLHLLPSHFLYPRLSEARQFSQPSLIMEDFPASQIFLTTLDHSEIPRFFSLNSFFLRMGTESFLTQAFKYGVV